jgi:hypothetical protein
LTWLIPRWISDRLDRQPAAWERPIAVAAKLVGADPRYWCNAAWWLTHRPHERDNIAYFVANGIMCQRSDGAWPEPRPGLKHACPVCRVPTLDQRGVYDICQVCWWEDDGIVDPDWPSGPNHRTLAQARQQFADGLLAYDRSEEGYARLGGGDPEVEALKHAMLACAASLRLMDQGPEYDACRDRLSELLAELEAVTLARLHEGEEVAP